MIRRRFLGIGSGLALLWGSCFAFASQADDPPKDATDPPPFEEFIVMPVRIHVLRASELPDIDCLLTDADIERILGKVNGIWHKAGIHFGVESIVREEAAAQKFFQLALSLNKDLPLDQYRKLRPQSSRQFDGLHVYFIHQFSVNGVYMHDDYVIVKETAALRSVPGGLDEPVPRVTSHELGHALGLDHRQDRTNLLASGTNGTLLNTVEVAKARAKTRAYDGAATVVQVRERARRAADDREFELARRLWTWLAQIPGDEAAEAKREAEALAQPEPKTDDGVAAMP